MFFFKLDAFLDLGAALSDNRERLRKDLREVYLKINRKVQARFLLRKACARSTQGPRAQGLRKASAYGFT